MGPGRAVTILAGPLEIKSRQGDTLRRKRLGKTEWLTI
jgi:hypothetical protein